MVVVVIKASRRMTRRDIGYEALGVTLATAITLLVMAALASAHPTFLFSDGDSVLPSLIVSSLRAGLPQDWALSPVLFIPETAVFLLLDLMGLGTRATLFVNGVSNLIGLYLGLRLLAGARQSTPGSILAGLVGFITFSLLMLLEIVGPQTWLLASLMGLTTYYYPTLFSMVIVIVVITRVRSPRVASTLTLLISAAAVFTNPLFVLWVTIPVCLALTVQLATNWTPRVETFLLLGATLSGTFAGYASRELVSDHIVAAGENYLRNDRGAVSLSVLSRGAVEISQTVPGALWLLLLAAIYLAALLACRPDRFRSGNAGTATALVASALAPPLIICCFVVAGADAWRYLQAIVLWPVISLVVAHSYRLPRTEHLQLRTIVVGATATLALLTIGITATVTALNTPDKDLQCAVEWIDRSGETGAGQFWSIRGPQAYVEEPASLTQIDHQFDRYDWLVNRGIEVSVVSFLVTSDRDAPYVPSVSGKLIDCGRYQIIDLKPRIRSIGAR